MITESYIEDTLVAMTSNFKFSITDDSLALDAMRWAKNGQRLILTYDEYKGKVLWRGNAKYIVTKIERDSDHIKSNPYQNTQANGQREEEKK
jgi:hypothetical protein